MEFTVSSDIIAELLEVAINSILYTRELYPHYVFERRKKYSIPVQMCIHPELKQYISDCVAAVKIRLEKGDVEKVAVTVLSENVPVEKFIFEVVQHAVQPLEIKEDTQLRRIEEALRAFCLKLSICDSLLLPLPENCSFVVQLHVPEKTQVEMCASIQHEGFPWIIADEEQVVVPQPHIVPLKSLNSEICRMQLYVEESKLKEKT